MVEPLLAYPNAGQGGFMNLKKEKAAEQFGICFEQYS